MTGSVDEADLRAAGSGGLPPKYCESTWRQQVIGLALTATTILVLSVHSYFMSDIGGHWLGKARAAHAEWKQRRGKGERVAAATMPAAVAGLQGAANPKVSLVAGAPATSFNRPATAVRPSVVGIRATLAGGVAGGTERLGSGVVVDSGGYVVTCRHVIEGAQAVVASRYREPQRWLPAEVVASEGDLALLRVLDGVPFQAAELADSRRVRVGDWVLAVGHPFGLGMTVTAGIVGQRNAALAGTDGRQYQGLLQTDAPINEGSSGGPLVDASGKVIGVNTAIYAPTGVFSGAGFAIPSSRIQEFLSRALRQGPSAGAPATPMASAVPGEWGVGLIDLTPALTTQLGYSGLGGVVVSSVASGSPAEAAQLRRGDVITAIAGRIISDVAAVARVRSGLLADRTIPVQVWRRGQVQTLVLRSG